MWGLDIRVSGLEFRTRAMGVRGLGLFGFT